ncbi:MAG TPA: hypothetical protein VHJ17_23130 [Thermomonospora sp.]|nr:hypothetical protein [Thermomonospora sp.]
MRSLIRRTSVAVATLIGATTLAAVVPATAHAAPCTNATTPVLERDLTVDWGGAIVDHAGSLRGFDLRPGDAIEVVNVGGDIWAGVAFTGRNGPRGWENWPAPDDGRWPLPGVNLYSLIGQFKDRHTGVKRGAFFIGNGTERCIPVPHTGTSVLFLEHNDQWPLDNDGAFTARVRVWRPA